MEQCILLNADYSFMNVVDWRRALRLVVKEKVTVLSYSERFIQGVEGMRIRVPAVMKLIKLIRSVYRTHVPFSKRNVLIRDNFTCGYCASQGGRMTIDHIVPRSRGGPSTFENCVCCCRTCNTRKGSRTPHEARMYLKRRPQHPTIYEFLRLRLRRLGIQDLWAELEMGSS
ncbi:MAG: HNH endonuclease [Desulfatitalea sp.]|nr:HNH endonuclease [Desulfatitalea sp.]NNK00427.1 HNH endonuclease [Desulfatitalea sp.]